MSEEKATTDSPRPTDGAFRLDDEVAIVSGAGTYGGSGVGNGAAAAILLARRGARVVLVDRELEHAEATREKIQADGGEAVALQADVTDPDDCRTIVEETAEEFGQLDILHNNVGGGPRDNVVDADDETWQRSIALNLMSAIYMCRYSVPHMRESGGGSITCTSSLQARRPAYDYLPYTVTKTALEGLTRGTAIDHAKDNIRVNCIMPGPIWTPKVASSRDEEERRLRRESVPLPKEGEPWDVGWAVVFLASDEAAWITGQTLPVDGGALLTRGGDRPGEF